MCYPSVFEGASREQKNLIFHSQLNLMEQISTKWHPGKGYQPYKQLNINKFISMKVHINACSMCSMSARVSKA